MSGRAVLRCLFDGGILPQARTYCPRLRLGSSAMHRVCPAHGDTHKRNSRAFDGTVTSDPVRPPQKKQTHACGNDVVSGLFGLRPAATPDSKLAGLPPLCASPSGCCFFTGPWTHRPPPPAPRLPD